MTTISPAKTNMHLKKKLETHVESLSMLFLLVTEIPVHLLQSRCSHVWLYTGWILKSLDMVPVGNWFNTELSSVSHLIRLNFFYAIMQILGLTFLISETSENWIPFEGILIYMVWECDLYSTTDTESFITLLSGLPPWLNSKLYIWLAHINLSPVSHWGLGLCFKMLRNFWSYTKDIYLKSLSSVNSYLWYYLNSNLVVTSWYLIVS